MNNPEEIKQYISPTQIAQYYLGQPIKRTNIGNWYRSPFRNERTASFLVYNENNRGMCDFGTNRTFDIIDFVQEYFRVDFRRAMKILCVDFGLSYDEGPTDTRLKEYLRKRQEEQKKAEYIIKTWYNQRFSNICDELHLIQNIIPHLKGEALAIAYQEEVKCQCLSEIYMDIKTEEDKLKLYKIWKNRRKGEWI